MRSLFTQAKITLLTAAGTIGVYCWYRVDASAARPAIAAYIVCVVTLCLYHLRRRP
jgi:hypothetical protein